MPVLNRIAAFHDDMTAWRHDFHMFPETAYEEVRTSEIVATHLQSWGIEVHRGLGKTGVVGILHGSNGPSGRAIALRADMDALNMQEENDFPHRSRVPGKMHGCGHDGHTAMLLGAARYLAETRHFDGTVVLIFQPAEEGGAGARAMMQDGLFQRFPVDTVWGLHNWPLMRTGRVAVHAGAAMAAADEFSLTIRGKGGHAAVPHWAVDPVVIGAQIVTALQTLVSRGTDPVDTAVVSVTKFHSGTAFNVIAETAELGGTLRSFRPETRQRLAKSVGEVAQRIAEALGGSVEYHYHEGYPPTVNSAAEAEFAARVAGEILGETNVVRDPDPSMGGEDFAFMLEEKPGAYIWLGGGGRDSCMVHNPRYDFNDEILPIGATYWARLAETALPVR